MFLSLLHKFHYGLFHSFAFCVKRHLWGLKYGLEVLSCTIFFTMGILTKYIQKMLKTRASYDSQVYYLVFERLIGHLIFYAVFTANRHFSNTKVLN